MKKWLRQLNRWQQWCLAAVLALVLVLGVVWLWPVGLQRQARGVVLVQSSHCYAVPVGTGDTLYFSPSAADDALATVSATPDSVAATAAASGFFVSPRGLVVTVDRLMRTEGDEFSRMPARTLLERRLSALDTLSLNLAGQLHELAYYARTHSPIDDGYQRVMEYDARVRLMQQRADTLRLRLRRALAAPRVQALARHRFSLLSVQPLDSSRVVSVRLEAHLVAQGDSLLLLQTKDGALPPHAYRFATHLLSADRWPLLSRARCLLGIQEFEWERSRAAATLPDALPLARGPRPHFDLAQGGPAVNGLGHLVGVEGENGLLNATHVNRLLSRRQPAPLRLLRNLWHRVWPADKSAAVQTDTLARADSLHRNIVGHRRIGALYGVMSDGRGGRYEGRLENSLRQGSGRQRYADGTEYRGRWRADRREGYGVFVDSTGRRYAGLWRADTLAYGCDAGAEGLYAGGYNRRLEHSGHGVLRTPTGSCYDGRWRAGRREGFGFAVEPDRLVRAGIWANGRFRGEQMVYTPERVYGIDISRYQHEVGRRRYSIDWPRLRITGLGHTGRRVQGQIDYPVSFIYIKATQGTTIRSRYYRSDAAAARRQDLAVGAYHFFSMKDGARQARYFLQTARPQRGDLAPMLDVELTDRQIKKMGGRGVMFAHMLAWLRMVEQATGCRPVLYVGQSFVNRHLPHAPAALRAYKVWIARYGEYRPYVHLLYWQLSPNGRVRGIHGEVDINVFNGTRTHFAQMVQHDGVKRNPAPTPQRHRATKAKHKVKK